MTSEASLLSTDLRTHIRLCAEAGEKCFLNCLRANLSCMNAFEIKTCKGDLFVLANGTKYGTAIYMCKHNLETMCSPTLGGTVKDGIIKYVHVLYG